MFSNNFFFYIIKKILNFSKFVLTKVLKLIKYLDILFCIVKKPGFKKDFKALQQVMQSIYT